MKRGPGRPKGKQNKVTTELKDAILASFDAVGGQEYLVRVAKDDPKTFCSLLGKVLPKDMNITVNKFEHMSDDELRHFIRDGSARLGIESGPGGSGGGKPSETRH